MDRIVFAASAREELSRLLEGTPPEEVFFVADGNTRRFFPGVVPGPWCDEGRLAVLPPGEVNKNLAGVERVWTLLHEGNARRSSVLVNIGGGVVADTGGFAATTFKRGMRFVNVPTTLLAQVDASLGGKTGVDFMGCKNEIGAFARPERVVVSSEFLSTLPERELLSGLADTALPSAILSRSIPLPARQSRIIPIRAANVTMTPAFFIIKTSPFHIYQCICKKRMSLSIRYAFS